MKRRIYWTERAKNDYRGILNYLNQNWSPREIIVFSNKIDQNLSIILLHPEIGMISKRNSVRRMVISTQTSLYYKIINGDIYIISLFDNRQNPKKL